MINIRRSGKKYVLDTKICYDDLSDLLVMEVEALKIDMPTVYREMEFTVIEGDLYAHHEAQNDWYFFDTSTRHWAECDDPTEGKKG